MLVFVKRKVDADRLARAITRSAAPATSIHSDRRQEDRIAALEAFRRGEYPVMVATDVAARGIDVEGISHVVNFDVPFSPDDYIHRGGRTARAGAVGEVLTFVAPEEEDDLLAIEKAIGTTLPRVILPNFDHGVHEQVPRPVHADERGRRGGGAGARGAVARAAAGVRPTRAPPPRPPSRRRAARPPNPATKAERRGGRCRHREAPPAAPRAGRPDPRPRYPPNESEDGGCCRLPPPRSARRPRRRPA